MAFIHSTKYGFGLQSGPVADRSGLEHALDSVTDAAQPLLDHLQKLRRNGRPGYPLKALWRAYAASYFLNLSHTNALIRRLQEDENLRKVCGLGDVLPHRTTFNRFIRTLSRHTGLLEQASNIITDKLRDLIPDLGAEVAVDSTVVRTHANPNRRHFSDPEASWTAKNSAHAPDGKEWHYGYKVHMLADTVHGIPLALIATTAKRNDSPYLPRLVGKAQAQLPWLDMKALMADKGYDALSNHEYLVTRDILPVILMRKIPGREASEGLRDGVYTADGVPTCVGQVPMQYIRTDPERGHLYRCRGCHLADSTKGMTYHCNDEVWEHPSTNIKVVGILSRASPEWKALYAKRQGIERIFKSMKQSRRLEGHCVRGLAQITLHTLMSTLAYSATALVKVRDGSRKTMRWMVEKVA